MRRARTRRGAIVIETVFSFRGVRWGRTEFEDVDRIACAADAKKGAGGVEGHAVDPRWHAAATELVEFFCGGYGEDANDGTFVGGGGEEGACVVEADAGERGAVSFGDIDGFEFQSVKK